MAPPRMILCLGSQRSGLVAAMAALGAAVPSTSDASGSGASEIQDLDRRVATVLGDPAGPTGIADDSAAASNAAMAALEIEASDLLCRIFGNAPLGALPLARSRHLVAFWAPALRAAGYVDLGFVHVLPGPQEDAAPWLTDTCETWQAFPDAVHVLCTPESLDGTAETLSALARAIDLTPESGLRGPFRAGSGNRREEGANFPLPKSAPLAAEALAVLRPLADMRRLSADDMTPVLSLWGAPRIQPGPEPEASVTLRSSLQHLSAELSRARGETVAQQEEVSELLARIDLLRGDLALHEKRLTEKETELAAVYASASWRLSAPVRWSGRLGDGLKDRLRRGWTWFNHFGRRVYRGLFPRAPRLAEAIRIALAPVLDRGNRAILKRVYVPAARTVTPLSLDHPGASLAYQAAQAGAGAAPLVSILVPNYNHAPYLRQRLDSIYAQTYRNFEVILMDDCSRDDSRDILTEYAERYPDRTRAIFNEVNSGGAFFQWEKGIRAAKGDLIWIAESDDWCTPDFLASLVPFFANDGVQMAYAPTIFMNEAGTEETWTLWDYLSGLGPERWRAPFVLPAPVIVREAFAARNIIPNTSSAIFRRPDPDRLDALEAPVWRSMRTCGDWVFYLNLIRGGMLAYSPQAQNFYRQHGGNTSVGSFRDDSYYKEHEEVAKCVQRHYRVDPSVFLRQRQDLALHWTRNRGGLSAAGLAKCYDLAAIHAEGARRRPHLLMASYAFVSGGGETFPVLLANLMKAAGFTVTFLNCDQEPSQPTLRARLASDIPVLSDFEDLAAIVRDFDIDVIHSHHAWVDNTVLDRLPEDSPVRTVITLHGMYETIVESQLKRMLPRLVQRTARMVCVAEKNAEAIVTKGGMAREALVRIDNALPRSEPRPVSRAELGLPESAFVLTVVSRAMPEKGWEEAIAAVGRAREISGRDIRLVLVGDGSEQIRLSPIAPDFVRFAGFQPNTGGYFAAADLGLLPSRFKGESFPLVLIDCLNAGRPMLASDLGEIARMLDSPDGPAGEVFALKDWQVPIEQLAARIAALSGDLEALTALRARVPAARAKFDPDRMVSAYAAVYAAAVADRLQPDDAGQVRPNA